MQEYYLDRLDYQVKKHIVKYVPSWIKGLNICYWYTLAGLKENTSILCELALFNQNDANENHSNLSRGIVN